MLQQSGGGFLSHSRHTGNVVDLVAHQRQQINDQRRRYAEFVDDTVVIHGCVVHGVDQRDVVVNQLRHVLIAGRDHHLSPTARGLDGQRADDVVCLDTPNTNQRQAHGANGVVDRLDLLAQLIRHGRAIGFVLRVDVVAEGGTLGIEYHDHLITRVIGHQLADHADDPFGRARVQALRVRERGQGVISAKQIR